MITALISGLFGLANAFLPDVFGMFKKKQEAAERREERAHEILMLEKQAEIQVKLGQQRVEEVKVGGIMDAVREELKYQGEQMKAIYAAQKPIGVKWVDVWNAALRPFAVTCTTLIFVAACSFIMYGVVIQLTKGEIGAYEAGGVILGGILGEFIQAVWGYLFGYRGGLKVKEMAHAIRS